MLNYFVNYYRTQHKKQIRKKRRAMVGIKEKTSQKKWRRIRKRVQKILQLGISTLEQEGVKQQIATALLKGYNTSLLTTMNECVCVYVSVLGD